MRGSVGPEEGARAQHQPDAEDLCAVREQQKEERSGAAGGCHACEADRPWAAGPVL